MHASVRTRIAAAAVIGLVAVTAVATATMAGASPAKHPNPHHTPSASASPTPTAPAAPAKAEPTRLIISGKAIAHLRHHADRISGVLSADDTGVAGETVVLEARSGTMPRWHAVASGVTGMGGVVTFTVAPTVKTQYRLVFAGDSKFRKSHSNVITLKVVK